MTRSPPGPHQASPNQSGNIGNNSSSYNSATWERTLRMNSSSSLVVPPPLGSAPPPSTANAALSPIHHKPVRASLSSLSSSQMSTSGEASTANMVNISNSNPGLSMDESWYRSNKIATAKTLQLQRQLSAGSFKTAGGMNFYFLSSSFSSFLGHQIFFFVSFIPQTIFCDDSDSYLKSANSSSNSNKHKIQNLA